LVVGEVFGDQTSIPSDQDFEADRAEAGLELPKKQALDQ
jgi:hypothetical protein